VTRRKSDKAAINELELNGARITNSTEIAEGFNEYFSEIGPELSIEEVKTSFDEFVTQTSSCFSSQRVTQLNVLSHLNKLCKRKATEIKFTTDVSCKAFNHVYFSDPCVNNDVKF